ncbi:hypothetical protein GCM10010398_24200 [Streptomyces fimbriatus]
MKKRSRVRRGSGGGAKGSRRADAAHLPPLRHAAERHPDPVRIRAARGAQPVPRRQNVRGRALPAGWLRG